MKLKKKVSLLLVKILNKVPYVKELKRQLNIYKTKCPPGHFYNPIPDLAEVEKRKEIIFGQEDPLSIDLNYDGQIALLEELGGLYNSEPFPRIGDEGLRYKFENDQYSFTDSIFLSLMIRYLKPKRIIEVGSGFSSAMMLDTNDRFFNGAIQMTFIEPYPDRLNKLLQEKDRKKAKLYETFVQDIDTSTFLVLEEGDILFIDCSHIVKTGSDLHKILFYIIPKLKKGVFIHFHDIFYPFEYPFKTVMDQNYWNEIYLLRAFLMNNNDFKIRLFADYLHKTIKDWFVNNLPLAMKNTGGNIWIEKIN